MEDGRIRDQGSHEELIARPGLYQRIHRIQAGLEDELGLEDRAAEGSLA